VADAARALGERWIDVYETTNKRSGAYCTSVHRTTPYVLLNHKKTYDGLSTLCHEMGHAMHSFYSNQNQPFAKADYTIFVAEVASTLNEILLYEYLMKQHGDDRRARIALVGSMLEHFRTTVFRQTMFAEFEHKAHRMAEEGQSLTKDSLNAM
jgi:oligoendopeptidase F